MSVPAIGDHQFQYRDLRHQADTATVGMWLFLATEVLLFGALFLVWMFCRHWQPTGFDAGARETDLALGTSNTFVLVTSSATYAVALDCLDRNRAQAFFRLLLVTAALGCVFIALKGLEWGEDFSKHLFPGSNFTDLGELTEGAQLFFSFYFVGTALHAVHMSVGIALVAWAAWRARRQGLSARYRLTADVVGLYWSFVDIVWLVLYPLIYLIGRAP
jgi:cytochrome c oxidase subunit 3